MSRYESTSKGINRSEFYEEFRKQRSVNRFEQYRTSKFPILTAQVRRKFSSLYHTWKMGDSFWKLAGQHYGDERLWWVIAWYNEKPTESHAEVGGIILIPKPVDEVVAFFHAGV